MTEKAERGQEEARLLGFEKWWECRWKSERCQIRCPSWRMLNCQLLNFSEVANARYTPTFAADYDFMLNLVQDLQRVIGFDKVGSRVR